MTGPSQPALLIVGGAKPSQGMRCVRQAQRRGLRVVLLDSPANLAAAPEIAAAADATIGAPFDEPDRCVEAVRDRAAGEAFLGTFAWREYAVESAAAVAEALHLPGNPRRAVTTVRDKYACREALRAAGFPQPCARACSDPRDALAFMGATGEGPWIVKPRDAMGSLGVRIVRRAAELPEAHAALPARSRGDFLIETFQPGEEYSAEGVFVAGAPHVLALTAKQLLPGEGFVERGHVMPARLPPAMAGRARAEVERALRALGLGYGIFHVEFWLDGDAMVLGEVHARPGGDYIHLMVELVTGLELYGVVYDQLLGATPDPARWASHGGAAILYFTPPPGRVLEVGDTAAAARDPDCVRLELSLRPGDRVGPIRESEDRPGFVLTRGETPEAARAAAQRLHDLAGPRMAPEPGAPPPAPPASST